MRSRRPDRIATRVTVTEGKHRKVNFGFGYGTEEKARGEVDWRHVNFFGGARTAGVFARYSALDRGVRLNFRQPYFFSPRLFLRDERAVVVHRRARVPAHDHRRARDDRAGVVDGRRSPLGARQTTVLALTYANEWEDYTISNEALLRSRRFATS